MKDYNMMHFLKDVAWPFLITKSAVAHSHIRQQRVVEAVIIAVISGALSAGMGMYVTQAVLEAKLNMFSQQAADRSSVLQRQLDVVTERLEEMRRDLYAPKRR